MTTYVSDAAYGVQSSGNTTTTVTTSFTGTAEQNPFPDVMVSCFSDVAGTIFFDFSVNGTDWRTFPSSGFAVSASIHEFHTAVKGPRYFRVRWFSSSTPTTLQIYTYYGVFSRLPSSPNNQSLGLDSDSISVRPTDLSDEVSIGLRPGVSNFNKFGYRTATSAAAGEQTLWADNSNLTIMTAADTFTITYNNATDGAGGGATGATQLLFTILDANEKIVTQTHTLGSSGSDTTSFTGLGINRCVVLASGSSGFNVNDITITETTGGTTQAIIPAGGSVTQQMVFFFPDNAIGIAKWLRLSTNKLSGSNPKVTFKGYAYSRITDTTYEVFRETVDTQSDTVIDLKDPIGFPFSRRDVVYFVMDTDQNNTIASGRLSLRLYNDE